MRAITLTDNDNSNTNGKHEASKNAGDAGKQRHKSKKSTTVTAMSTHIDSLNTMADLTKENLDSLPTPQTSHSVDNFLLDSNSDPYPLFDTSSLQNSTWQRRRQ